MIRASQRLLRGRRLASVLACSALCLVASDLSAAPLYSEGFPNPGGAKNFASVGWKAHIGATATDFTNTTSVGSTDPAVIWNTAGQDGTNSYGFSSNPSGGGLWWTEEFAAIPQASVDAITFYTNNSNTTSTLRVAVRVDSSGTPGDTADDTWFASNATYIRDSATAGSSGNWVANGELETFDFTTDASAWRELTFNPGTSLALAAAARTAALPTGNITAAGLYGTGSGFRFDTYQIQPVPEPSALAIGGIAVAGLLLRRRSRES